MKTETTKKRKVTITPEEGDLGMPMSFEAEVLLHYHDVDGSEILLMKTDRRESVNQFLYDEVVKNGKII